MKFLNIIKNSIVRLGLMIYIIACSIALLITAIVAGYYTFLYARGEIFVTGNGNNNVNFNIFYVDNPIWETEEIDRSYHFLMSFVDRIQVLNFGNLNFSEVMDVTYTYDVTETLIIRAGTGSDVSNAPIVYTRTYVLAENSGEFTSRNTSFGNNSTSISAGGEFYIDPIHHIRTYMDFMEIQANQMLDRDLLVAGGRAFSAELLIEIVFRFSASDTEGLNVSFNNQTMTNGYRIALSNEVFYMSHINGSSSFSANQALGLAREMTNTHVAVLSGSVVINVVGIIYCISLMKRDKNKLRYKTLRLIKKYSHEVLVLPNPLDVTGLNLKVVNEFEDVLKLAVNLNKHITCYHTRRFADFYVEVEGYVYHYHVSFQDNDDNDENPPFPSNTDELDVYDWEYEEEVEEHK